MTWGSSLKFLLTVVFCRGDPSSQRIACKKKNVIPFGHIPTLHNLLLAVGSAIMFLGCLQATVVEVERSSWLWGGPKQSIDWVLCFPVGTRAVGAVFFWSYVYYLSELYELLDTFILILKKRPLTFLHVFHHATVIIMCYLWLQFVQSLEIITLLTNTIVHVIMYSYYFLCSINHAPPWKKMVTNLQNVQFLFSFVASVATLWLHFKGRRDGGGWSSMYAWLFNAFFNITLLLLFLNFHSKQYGAKNKSRGSSSHSNKQAWLDSPPPHFVALYGWSCNGCNEAAAPCNSLTQERNFFLILKRKINAVHSWSGKQNADRSALNLGLETRCASIFSWSKIRMCISLCQAFDLKSKYMCNQSLGFKSKTYVHHYWINLCYTSVCTLKGFISFLPAWILQLFLALEISVLKRGKSISMYVLTFATVFPGFAMTLSCLVSCHFFLVLQWCSTVSFSSLFCSC